MNAYENAYAAHVLRQGGVVANATEGVWGVCCDPWQQGAVERLLHAKRRSWREGLILVAHAADVFAHLLRGLDASRRQLIDASWPGPVTWLVPHHHRVPRWVHGAHDTVALRVTAHPQFSDLCRRFGGALTSSSANRSGRPPVSDATMVRSQLGRDIDHVLPGSLGGHAGASTIVDVLSLRVLRGDASAVPGLDAVRSLS